MLYAGTDPESYITEYTFSIRILFVEIAATVHSTGQIRAGTVKVEHALHHETLEAVDGRDCKVS